MLKGVDTLRFVAAAWVALAHGGLFPFTDAAQAAGGPVALAAKVFGGTVDGSAAVALFFVISGLCIHYPNVGKARLDWSRFLVKRITRIVPPLLAAMLLANLMGPSFRAFFDLALWSIYCEIAYYLAYPLLFPVLDRHPGKTLLMAFGLAVILAVAIKPGALFAWEFGPATWLVFAHLWLAGALIADRIRRRGLAAPISIAALMAWRGGAVLLSAMVSIATFHLPVKIGVCWTFLPISLYALAWIPRELASYEARPPLRLFEWAGLAGYSSYLMHTLAIVLGRTLLAGETSPALWPVPVVLILGMSAMFYFVVEKPAHRLAQWLGRRVRLTERRAAVIPPATPPIGAGADL